MKRKQIPSKIRLAMFLNANRQCQSCQSVIHPGQKWEIDHIIPLGMGGPDIIENMQILCKICHRFKTNHQDMNQIAKAKRLEIIHFGAKKATKRPIIGSKSSKLKKKLNGEIVIR
jgi:5-methylcytosine-specific restriction endonuclease McrA